MHRIAVLITLTALVLFAALPVQAQQAKKVPRIGFLSVGSVSDEASTRVEAFRQGLRERGYVDGLKVGTSAFLLLSPS